MMKNDELKKAFQSNFLKDSPSNLSSGVMQKIEASQEVKALLPRYVLWLLGITFFVLFVFLLFTIDTSNITFSPATFVELWQNNLYLFILPFCVLTLQFIQSIWYKKDQL